MLRGIAVRESTWFQGLTDPSGGCVVDWGCGDIFSSASSESRTYCDGLATVGGYDYQQEFADGICPKTFSIAGVMSWDDPAWQAPAPAYPDDQNGTFPFNRDSTAFAVDYLGSYLRGCVEGWVLWMHPAGGDMWGCVGSWYSGDWHSSAADGYINRVQNEIAGTTWLDADFPGITP
jgi:autotransporter family porin